MSNTLNAIHILEQKLKSLLVKFEELKDENTNLHQEKIKLQKNIIAKEQLLTAQQREYELLKVAKTIEGSSNNTKDTKLKINSLIREIDKCIIQLQE